MKRTKNDDPKGYLPMLEAGQVDDRDEIMNAKVVKFEGAKRVEGFITVADALNEISALGVIVPWKTIVRNIANGMPVRYGEAMYRKAARHEIWETDEAITFWEMSRIAFAVAKRISEDGTVAKINDGVEKTATVLGRINEAFAAGKFPKPYLARFSQVVWQNIHPSVLEPNS